MGQAMKRLGLILVFLTSLACAHAQFLPGPGLPVTSSGGGCAQATTFLARTSGLSGTESSAATAMICGLVSDGVITGTLSGANGCGAYIDGLYILATNTTGTAALNICGTAQTITTTGGNLTFTADLGYSSTGDALNTNYVPSTAALNMTQNSAWFMIYDQTATTTDGTSPIGAANSAYTNVIQLDFTSGPSPEIALNSGKNGYTGAGSSQGCWAINRNTAGPGTTGFIRRNAAALTSLTSTSTGLPNVSIYLLGVNQGGGLISATGATISAAAFGGGTTPLSTTLADALCNRVNTYMTALGHNVY